MLTLILTISIIHQLNANIFLQLYLEYLNVWVEFNYLQELNKTSDPKYKCSKEITYSFGQGVAKYLLNFSPRSFPHDM